ncbi:hypothetical protein [Salinicola tamaricis]|uniref:hypothetical protein n=1 Tax=Salinicola tamaricis TaxID=1771309 RepID=UPI0013EB3F19|nr:hypothetical protein [Salinicola tamaricis]
MNVFNRLFSMLAAVIVSALLPFSMSAESETSPHQNLYGASSLSTSVSDDRRQDGSA